MTYNTKSVHLEKLQLATVHSLATVYISPTWKNTHPFSQDPETSSHYNKLKIRGLVKVNQAEV